MPLSNRIQVLRRRAFNRQGGRCYYCGVCMWLESPDELLLGTRSHRAIEKVRCTAEHLIAQCDGGRTAATNIVAACARCNRGRHKLHKPPEPIDYRQHVERQAARRCWHQRWVYEAGLVVS